MVVNRFLETTTPRTLIDVMATFRIMPVERRHEADRLADIGGVIPCAFRIVAQSLSDPLTARTSGGRIGFMCRQLSSEEASFRALREGLPNYLQWQVLMK
jgi:hypothetical protein